MRVDNWPSLLDEYLRDEKPFEWGVNDCCLFACNAAILIANLDPAERFRGKYKTKAGADRWLKKGMYALIKKEAEKLNIEEIHPNMAQRGDIVLVSYLDNDRLEQQALGIINLAGKVAGQGENGVVVFPLSFARAAWRIE